MTREVSRQTFIRGALGLATAGALGACSRTETLAAPNWTALSGTIDGRVFLPPSAEYTTAKGLFNTRYANSTPAAVVTPKSVSDVQRSLAFAAQNGLKVTARSGGHSYIGASAANSAMVLDLRQLPGAISYDAGTGLATVPAAVDLNSVQEVLNTNGRSIPTGSCPSVGAAGLTLGGGLGADARQFGLTCDALVSASVVLPSGQTVTASATDHPDLFWALRGGGGGNCGIATSFTYRTFPAVTRDVVSLSFPYASTAKVLLGWNSWLRSADRTTWGMVNITAGPPAARKCRITLATAANGGGQAANAIVAAIGVAAETRNIQTKDHMDFVRFFAGGAGATRPRTFLAGSDIVGEMTQAAADSIVKATNAWPATNGAGTAVVESLSGAIGDIAPSDSAFPWRRHAAVIQWYTEAPLDTASTWLIRAHQAVQANSVGGYVNYVEPETVAGRYFGDNLARLNGDRQLYDPSGLIYSGLATA